MLLAFSVILPRTPTTRLFPYTTLFRSVDRAVRAGRSQLHETDLLVDLVVVFGDEARIGVEGLRTVDRSEEHTSELQSRGHLVCRLLLEKKNSTQLSWPAID